MARRNEIRFDRSHLGKGSITGAGALRVPASIARTGVQAYHSGGKTWNELRPPSEVFDAHSIASLRALPVTIGHEGGIIDPSTAKDQSYGHTGDSPNREGDWLKNDLVISDGATIVRVRDLPRNDPKRLCEISAGYICDTDPTPGVWEGVPYACVQRNIRYNHVTLLPLNSARAGSGARIHLDSKTSADLDKTAIGNTAMKKKLKLFSLDVAKGSAHFDGKDFDLSDPKQATEVAALRTADIQHVSRLDALTAEELGPMVEDLAASLMSTQGIVSGLLEALQEGEEMPTTEEGFEEMIPAEIMDSIVSKRVTAYEVAKSHGIETKGKDLATVKLDSCKQFYSHVKFDSMSPEQVGTLFSAIPVESGTFTRQDRKTIESGAKDGAKSGKDQRKDRRSNVNKAYKKKTDK